MSVERDELTIVLPERLPSRIDVSLRSTVNGQVQANRLTAEDLQVITDGSIRTASTIVGGANEVDKIQGFTNEPTDDERKIYRFRYQRPIHIANVVSNEYGEVEIYTDTKETLNVGPVLEGLVRNVDGRAKEIELYEVRKYS